MMLKKRVPVKQKAPFEPDLTSCGESLSSQRSTFPSPHRDNSNSLPPRHVGMTGRLKAGTVFFVLTNWVSAVNMAERLNDRTDKLPGVLRHCAAPHGTAEPLRIEKTSRTFVACTTYILHHLHHQPALPLQAGLVPFQVRSFVHIREDALSDSIMYPGMHWNTTVLL